MVRECGRTRPLASLLLGSAVACALVLTGCGLSALVGGAAVAGSDSSSSRVVGQPQTLVSSVSPASGSHGGGQTVTIRGANFSAQGLIVLFGDRQATVEQVVSSQELRVTLPALTRAGATTVRVSSDAASPGELEDGFGAENSVPALTVDPITDGQTGNVAVRALVTDPDRDTCSLKVEYQVDGGPFLLVTGAMITGGAGSLQNIATSATPPGEAHVFVVDTRQIIQSTNATLQLRLTPVDEFDVAGLTEAQRSGTSVLTGPFTAVNNSPPILTLISSPVEDDNRIPLTFQVSDLDGDAITLTRATFTNLQTQVTADATAAPGGVQVSATLTKDKKLVLLWDSRADLGFGNGALILFGLEVSDGTTTVARQFSPPFFVNNGPFEATQTLNTTLQSLHSDVGDVTGDGLLDLALAMSTGAELQLWEQDGSGNFTKKSATYRATPGTRRVLCGPIVALPGAAACIDIADIGSGVTLTTRQPDGSYPEPATVITQAQLRASFASSRAKVAARGDLSDPPDGLEDLVALLRDANGQLPSTLGLGAGAAFDLATTAPDPVLVTPVAAGKVRITYTSGGVTRAIIDDGAGALTGDVVPGAVIFYPTGTMIGLTSFTVDAGTPVVFQSSDAGTGQGQLVLFEGTGGGGFSTTARNLLPAALSFGVASSSGVALTVDRQPGDFNLKDVDGDGLFEVVVAAPGASEVRTYEQVTDGAVALVASQTIAVSVPGQALITADLGDFDGDGGADLIALTSDGAASTLLVYLSDALGSFALTPSHQVAVARRLDDLRVTNVTSAVDKDARVDVVVGDTTTTNIGVFVSDPTTASGFLERGGAVVEVAFPAGSQTRSLSLGDFNRDGHVDVACAAPFSNVPIIRVAKPRQFLDAVPVSVRNSATTLDTGDVLGNDGADECLAIDSGTKDLLILGNDPVLTLAERRFSPFRADQRVITIDLDGDGERSDILHLVPDPGSGKLIGMAIIPADSPDLRASRPSADGSFLDPLTLQFADPLTDPDLAGVIARDEVAHITTTLTLAGGSRFVFFGYEEAGNLSVGFPSAFAAGLAFGDAGRGDDGAGLPLTAAGLPDIIVSPGVAGTIVGVGPDEEAGVHIFYGKGGGQYTLAVPIVMPVGSSIPGRSGTLGNILGGFSELQLVDLDNDGRLSLVGVPIEEARPPDVTGAEQNCLVVLNPDAGHIGLVAHYNFDVGNAGNGQPFVGLGIAAFDFDQDGFADLALASNLGPTANVLFNQAPPSFTPAGAVSGAFVAPPLELPSEPRCVMLRRGDVDGDGQEDDLVMSTLGLGALMVYTSNGDGTFNVERRLAAPEPFWMALGDFNGDGRIDAVSSDRGSGILRVFIHK